MKYRVLSVIVLVTLALISVVGVSGQNGAAHYPVTVTDDLGREFTFDAPPQRVVLLSYQPIADLAALGIVPIAVREYGDVLARDPRNYGELADEFIVLDTSAADILETVAALQPDLVIGWVGEEISALETFTTVYAEIAGAEPLETVEDYTRYVEDFGIIFDKQAEAQTLIDSVLNRVYAYEQLAPGDRSISVIALADEGETIWFPPDCGPVLKRVATCGHSADQADWFTGTSEVLLSFDPDVVIVEQWTPAEFDWMTQNIAGDPLWQELTAVQSERIHAVAASDARAQNLVTVGRSLDAIMPLAYPETFPDGPLTDEQVEEILAGEEANTAAYTITDVNGHTLMFEEPPTRFVSIGNRDIEMLAALGIQPVGVSDQDFLIEMLQNPVYYPEPFAFERLPLNEETYEPDLEAVLALNPDVMFGSDEQRLAAQDIDLNVYAFYANNGPGTWQQGLEELRKLAALTGREAQAEMVIAEFEARLAAYKALAPMNRSVMLVGAVSSAEFYISTEVSGRCAIIREVATCPWPDPTSGESWSYTTNLEGVLALNPDVIILDNWGEWSDEEMDAQLTASPLWNELSAVQEGRVTPILESYNYVQGVGPLGNMRWLDLYMPVIYPETFPAPLTDEQVAEILAEGS